MRNKWRLCTHAVGMIIPVLRYRRTILHLSMIVLQAYHLTGIRKKKDFEINKKIG